MQKLLVPVVLVLLLLAGGWFVLGGEAPRSTGDTRVSDVRAQTAVEMRDRPAADSGPEEMKKPRARVSRSERDALRRRILDALEADERSAAGPGFRAEAGDEAPASAREGKRPAGAGVADEAPAAGNLIDRSGNKGYLLRVMNEELMPLADECFALARNTQPGLAGELRLEVEIIGDEELGGVVETVVPDKDNELNAPELIECMRESILSTTLPPPPQGGRDAFMLSLRPDPVE